LKEDISESVKSLAKRAKKASFVASGVEPAARVRATVPAEDSALFDELKQLRARLASERRVPAYVVFSDATLIEMAHRRPKSEAELLAISGVGTKKLETYGEVFLSVIARASS
jgi:ATP-dependent DNA helicase RecQ